MLLLEDPSKATTFASTTSASTTAVTAAAAAPETTNPITATLPMTVPMVTVPMVTVSVVTSGEPIRLPTVEERVLPLEERVMDLGLTGKLLFTQGTSGLWQADLETGILSQVLALPEGGHIGGLAVSPDGSQLVLAYGPPPEFGPQRFLTDLYLLTLGERELHPLLLRTAQVETYANPVWSPDGQWLYYSHLKQLEDGSGVTLNIERYALAVGGEPEIVMQDAHQPALSFDMAQLAFLHFDQAAQTNALWIAAIDGSDARELVSGDEFADILAPRFSGDGASIAFGASGKQEPEARSFWEILFDVKVAYAHGAPWALWSIAANEGPPEHLTLPVFDGTWPAWSPTGEELVFLEAAGIYWVSDDGLKLLATSTREGEVVWIR